MNFCFQNSLKTETDCCQTEQQIQRDARGSVHTACITQQCLHADCLLMIYKMQWPSNSPNLSPLQICLGSTKLFWQLYAKPKTVSELKVTLEKAWENFPQNKAVLSFRKRLREYLKAGGRHFEHCFTQTKCSHARFLHCLERY